MHLGRPGNTARPKQLQCACCWLQRAELLCPPHEARQSDVTPGRQNQGRAWQKDQGQHLVRWLGGGPLGVSDESVTGRELSKISTGALEKDFWKLKPKADSVNLKIQYVNKEIFISDPKDNVEEMSHNPGPCHETEIKGKG